MPRVRKQVPQGYAGRDAQPATQPIAVPTGRTYGQGTALANAERAVPLPQTSGAAGPAPTPGAPQAAPEDPMAAAQGYAFPEHVALTNPTTRPNEPITAGMRGGAGPGPESLPPMPQINQPLETLRALYAQTGMPEIQALLSQAATP